MRDTPADTGTLDPNGDLARLEPFALFGFLERRLGFLHPQLVLWVREDSNIRLRDSVGNSGHCGAVCLTDFRERRRPREGQESAGGASGEGWLLLSGVQAPRRFSSRYGWPIGHKRKDLESYTSII